MQVVSEDPNATHTDSRQIKVLGLANNFLNNNTILLLQCPIKGLTVGKFWDRVPWLDQVSISTFKHYKRQKEM